MPTEPVTRRFAILPDPERGAGAPMAAFDEMDRGGGLGVLQVGGRIVTSRLEVGREYEFSLRDVTGRAGPARVELVCEFRGDAPREPGQRYAILRPPGVHDPAEEVRVEGEALARLLTAGKRLRITVEELGDA